jgi:hypothetical protein
MRLLASCSAALLALVMLVVACNTVDPSECWVNTSGGFGGSGTMPIGSGVGGSSGDFISPPQPGPLGYGEPANPCVSGGSDTAQPGSPAPSMGSVISYFRTSNFSFVTTVPDDGQDAGGGYQESTTFLTLADGLTTVYSCRIHIGMPLRTLIYGSIPPFIAALYSTNVANAAAAALWPTASPQGVFCLAFKKEMGAVFAKLYPTLGASMMP